MLADKEEKAKKRREQEQSTKQDTSKKATPLISPVATVTTGTPTPQATLQGTVSGDLVVATADLKVLLHLQPDSDSEDDEHLDNVSALQHTPTSGSAFMDALNKRDPTDGQTPFTFPPMDSEPKAHMTDQTRKTIRLRRTILPFVARYDMRLLVEASEMDPPKKTQEAIAKHITQLLTVDPTLVILPWLDKDQAMPPLKKPSKIPTPYSHSKRSTFMHQTSVLKGANCIFMLRPRTSGYSPHFDRTSAGG